MLWQLQKLLSPEEAGDALDSNIECFHKASAIIKILLTSKVTLHFAHSSAALACEKYSVHVYLCCMCMTVTQHSRSPALVDETLFECGQNMHGNLCIHGGFLMKHYLLVLAKTYPVRVLDNWSLEASDSEPNELWSLR